MDALAYQQLLLELQQLREQRAQRDRVIEQLRQAIRDLQQRLDAADRRTPAWLHVWAAGDGSISDPQRRAGALEKVMGSD